MKRVGVITFHAAENAGAVLQCIALQTALKKYGVQPFVIDYQPEYIRKQYRILLNPFAEAKKKKAKGVRFLISVLAYMKQNFMFYNKYCRKKKFLAFRQKYINESRSYRSFDELVANPPAADIYIAGSDQIWNSNLTGGTLDPAFFLKFGNSRIKKFTYAISIGKQIDPDETQKIVNMTDGLKSISFRESSVCKKMETLFDAGRVVQSVDPTLLIDRNDWTQFVKGNIVKEKYILIYALEKNPAFKDFIESLKIQFPKVKIVDISQCNLNLSVVDIRKMGFSPDEFLSMIYYAEYIVTNSFHCTVFSTIFHKNYTVIPHTRSNARIYDLLVALGMEERIYNEFNINGQWRTAIDWIQVDLRIQKYRNNSCQYLQEMVQ